MNAHVFKSELINENRTSIVLINDDRQMLCEVKRSGNPPNYVPYEFATKPEAAEQAATHLRQGRPLQELEHKLGASLVWHHEVKGPLWWPWET